MRVALLVLAWVVAGCGARPAPTGCERDPDTCARAKAHALSPQLPPARGNAVADDPRALSLGFALFFDVRLSSTQQIRCATCHQPESAFDDGKPTSHGLEAVARNSPTLLNAAWLTGQLWDGRADSLWSQPLFAIEDPKEMGGSRLAVAHRIARSYREKYEPLFGPLPPLAEAARFPPEGKPGDAAYDAMAEADRRSVDLVLANVGKALEAYVRKLAAYEAPLETFLEGEPEALTDEQVKGLEVFFRAGCDGCHSGPLFTDEKFHNLGVPAAGGAAPDPGRAGAYAVLAASPFNAQGLFYDGAPLPRATLLEGDLGAFRTPSLRNLSLSAPYGHNGAFATVEQMVDFHLQGGGRGGKGYLGEVDEALVPRSLSEEERRALVAFLLSLEGRYPAPPYNNWPGR